MTRAEYEDYRRRVSGFLSREGLANLSWDSDTYEEGCVEPYVSRRPCDCCGNPFAGDRYDCAGYSPATQEVQKGYRVCEDCLYYLEYGRLDDRAMAEIEKDGATKQGRGE